MVVPTSYEAALNLQGILSRACVLGMRELIEGFCWAGWGG